MTNDENQMRIEPSGNKLNTAKDTEVVTDILHNKGIRGGKTTLQARKKIQATGKYTIGDNITWGDKVNEITTMLTKKKTTNEDQETDNNDNQ